MLKRKIVATMQQSYPGINPSIDGWKGQEITDFQEELISKVNAQISEKWFYNHMKSDSGTLPRIDVLNFLSRYVGYTNWDDFIFKNGGDTKKIRALSIRENRYFIVVPILVLIILGLLFLIYRVLNNREFYLTFYDAHTREPIMGELIEIKILSDRESPVNYLSDSAGNLVFKTDKNVVKMVISTPYYHTDTISRILKTFNRRQIISLTPNDYALIIHYFSEKNVDDWQKRRNLLNRIIDENAMIYQVFDDNNGKGMELFNKDEFIDKLTMPSSSLKNIKILESKLTNEKIMVLRFRVNRRVE
ncbi:MAG: hypothetical protein JW731_02605 [Bacteroidales bacterium]|nr:hypothetical protein [Bacteroidales bacterium]